MYKVQLHSCEAIAMLCQSFWWTCMHDCRTQVLLHIQIPLPGWLVIQ